MLSATLNISDDLINIVGFQMLLHFLQEKQACILLMYPLITVIVLTSSKTPIFINQKKPKL